MKVVSFVGGLTHLYNQGILKKCVPELKVVALLFDHLKYLTELEAVRDLGIDIVLHDRKHLDESLWDPRPDLLFLATAYPEPFRCGLVGRAIRLGIPVAAIEEVNQMANQNGRSTHYFLPVDQLGVASSFEAERFREMGFLSEQIVLTGWPFFSNNKGSALQPREKLRKGLGILPDSSVALLILSLVKEKNLQCFETLRMRKELLKLSARGIPERMTLVVKPHPAEDRDFVAKTVKSYAPRAILLQSETPIEEALSISDLVISLGNSQVVFEAMLRGLPLVIVPLGLTTMFDDSMPELIVRSPEDMGSLCRQTLKDTPDYTNLLSHHVPFSPEESLERTAHFIRQVISNPRLMPKWTKSLDLCLQMQFVGMEVEAREELKAFAQDESLPNEFKVILELLERLFDQEAKPSDIRVLIEAFQGHKIRQWHIQALWIRQMYSSRKDRILIQSGLPLVQSFDGSVNAHYFIHELLMRMDLEYAGGDESEADRLREWFERDFYFLDDFRKRDFRLRLFKDGRFDGHVVRYLFSKGFGVGRRMARIVGAGVRK